MTDIKRKPGRPRILLEGGKRLTVTLDPAAMAQALALGAGNPSAGIRAALASANPLVQERAADALTTALEISAEPQSESLDPPI